MILTIFGQPGSGKTTMSDLWMSEHPDWFRIDGDELREILPNKNYSIAGRHDNINRANTIATYLNHQYYHVVMSLVNPFQQLRRDLVGLNPESVYNVFLVSARTLKRENHFHMFEQPKMSEEATLRIDTSDKSIIETYEMIYEGFYHYAKGKQGF